MFKLTDDNDEGTIIKNWPVIISVPQDGGTVQQHQITADFLLLPHTELDEMAAALEGDGRLDVEMLRRVVKRVGNVSDANGAVLDSSPELIERLLKKAYVRAALIKTYHEAASGQKAKRKN